MNTDKASEDSGTTSGALIGTTLVGKYLIEEHLGSGGMCDVYRATHTHMGKQVAVKILKPQLASDPAIGRRFEQEARAASRIHHPNAINVMDYGIGEGNMPFIVMEYVNGITLGELIRRQGALPVERVANILRQICGALDDAHGVGVIHRDIKPDNIIIGDYGNSDWVEVVDFGVAKIQEDLNRRVALTGENILVGTPRYMSPEQCEERPVDARSDIYSLGIVLYEMLTGSVPFKWDSSTRLLIAHATEPPEPLRAKRPDLSAAVEAVVMATLEKDSARRPQSAGALFHSFEQAAGLGQPARAGSNRGGAFSRIHVPVGAEPPAPPVNDAAQGLDEATLVRPRPAQLAVSGSDTSVDGRFNTPANDNEAAYQDRRPLPGRPYVESAAQRRNQPLMWAALLTALAVAGIAAYLIFGNKGFGKATTHETLMDAQQSVTTAIALVDSLPKEHPLRTYLIQLRQWQGELKAYQSVSGDNSQVTERAERYRQQSDDIGGQARVALAALGREVPANVNNHAAMPVTSNENRSGINGSATNANREESAADDEAEPADEETAAKPQEEDRNANANRPRRAEPPTTEQVTPPEATPQNRNTRKHPSPPKVDPVNENESIPNIQQ